ncbi:MAG: helix-turn-helix transcriptional regulator [bacterium]|nr:helix-turn-helix transcriptional regulator [bacterium]
MSGAPDETSAALYNGVRRVLERMGIALEFATAVRGESRAPHTAKRALLDAALGHGGPHLILSLGEKLMRARSDPSVTVLRRATDPADALLRWQRLERFFHSRHRTETLDASEHGFGARHAATQGEAPAPVDDLLIAGIVLALIRAAGGRGVRARFGDGVPFVSGDEPCLARLSDTTDSATWWLEWDRLERPVPPTADEPPTDPEALEARLRVEFTRDPARAWTVADLASRCGMSARTLQRRLEAAGTNAGTLVRELRGRHAARMLAETEASLAQIGFASGYADQAHFGREFKRCIGMPPGRYRSML